MPQPMNRSMKPAAFGSPLPCTFLQTKQNLDRLRIQQVSNKWLPTDNNVFDVAKLALSGHKNTSMLHKAFAHPALAVWLLVVAGVSEAVTANVPKHDYNCTTFMVEVPINNATVIVPPFSEFPDQYAAAAWANQVTDRTPVTSKPKLKTLTKTFKLQAEYCTPAKAKAKSTTLQILSHGIGFDRSYWDFYLPSTPQDAQYSYINAATGAGYNTLSYNRLGIEPSDLADPYTEIQAFVEVELLASLTTLVRAGNISQVAVPQKVVHVGHSWGSEISVAVAASTPGLFDGIILQGYSGISKYSGYFVASIGFHLANLNQPKRFPTSKYNSGFLTWGDKVSNQYAFLQYPYFDPQVLEHAEATKYPFTVGEFLTILALPVAAPEYKGPVLYMASQADLIFCQSNCTGLFGQDSIAVTGFNGSSSVETHIQPNAGHGINLHYNATGAYGVMLDWASRHGL